jgi:hypothetical protein
MAGNPKKISPGRALQLALLPRQLEENLLNQIPGHLVRAMSPEKIPRQITRAFAEQLVEVRVMGAGFGRIHGCSAQRKITPSTHTLPEPGKKFTENQNKRGQ